MFEEDVRTAVAQIVDPERFCVRSSRFWNGDGLAFVADISIERADGQPIVSILCKSNPRGDRLQLALAEALIGRQKTGRPVVVVVPYLIEDKERTKAQFEATGSLICCIGELRGCLEAVTRKS